MPKAISTAQKMKFSIKDFFSKCDKIRSFLRIWSHALKKSVMENFISLCSAVTNKYWVDSNRNEVKRSHHFKEPRNLNNWDNFGAKSSRTWLLNKRNDWNQFVASRDVYSQEKISTVAQSWHILEWPSTILGMTFGYSMPITIWHAHTQPVFTYSKLTKETLEQGVTYIQS